MPLIYISSLHGMAKRVRTGGGTSPSTKKTKDKPGEVFICVKCSENVEEDSIECESCLKWEHRACAGISEEEYEGISGDLSTNIMFFCSVCRPKVRLALKFFNDIEEKQKLISESVKQLEEELKALNTKISQLSNQSNTLDTSSIVGQNDIPTATVEAESRLSAPKPSSSINTLHSNQAQPTTKKKPSVLSSISVDRKFNIVMFGIKESPPKTPKTERLEHELQCITNAFANVDLPIQANCIRDCIRLGKYKPEAPKPRPILIKFLRASEATMALSKISLFKSPIAIKPDLSQEERNIENFLLKKRWSLTQLGIDKKRIKIRNKSILIDNKLYGQFKNSEFSRSQYNPPLEATQKSQPDKEQSHLTDSDTSENTMDHSCSADKSSSLETTQKSQPNEEQPHLTNPDTSKNTIQQSK